MSVLTFVLQGRAAPKWTMFLYSEGLTDDNTHSIKEAL